ncbi:CYTH domain-containing protein [Rossellomorea sp. NS-SX7]|uniref:CYTH domain-containing protein n=1 Tax=Rossellomorea sp. NS-SX7 TaxID=3463856 RepID=UPI00405A33DB
MSQEIEIEFKNLLAEEEFMQLLKNFSINETDFNIQVNHYFDTPDFLLKNRQSALRIRQKKKTFMLTLKTPMEEGLLETNQPLSEQEADELLKQGIFPDGEVREFLQSLGVTITSIQHFGSLTTKRAEMKFEGGLLVFDESSYFDKVDFELEYEVKDYKQGEKIFSDLLKEHGIPKRDTENKIKRFYREKIRNQM